ncbi:MAG: nuclease [Spirochaetes bacterium]|jgi:endonuclease YncB( thermonuclease family)|nr:nuclease [Spirochaetota bacterium]
MRAALLLLLLQLLFPLTSAAASPQSVTGTVVEVRDGDTIEVDVGTGTVAVRLHGVDCPESGQPYGQQAARYTTRHTLGRRITVEVTDRDRYGRLVGIVWLPDGGSLNEALVAAGLAWWYRTYAPDDATLRRAEQQARDAQRGLWSRPGAVPPWEWRRGSRGDGALYSGSTSARKGIPCSRASFMVRSAFDSATSLV